MRVGRGTGPYPSASSRSISQTNAHLLSARLSRGAVCVPRRKKLDQLRGSGLRERAVLAAVLFFEELGQLDRLSLEWLRVLGIGLVRVNEDLLELGPDELAFGKKRAGKDDRRSKRASIQVALRRVRAAALRPRSRPCASCHRRPARIRVTLG